MEPSSTHSSDRTQVDSHELQNYPPSQPSPTIQPEQATGRARVRFNSSAAEIPPRPERRSYSRVSESETSTDEHTSGAQDLLDAHHTGLASPEHFHPPTFTDEDPDASYAVTGNATGGVFYQLLQAYKTPIPHVHNDTPSDTTNSRPGSSGAMTPSRKKWYNVEKGTQSQETLATLIGASAALANPNDKKDTPIRPKHKRTSSGGVLAKVWKAKEDKDARIKIHVANILKRQQYIIRMCRALMLFGAPTHRLEEYLATTAKVLEINSQFLYIPGCMIISCK